MTGSCITKRERAVFLAALAKDPCVSRAARRANRRPNLFYALRDHDQEFADKWLAALNGRRAGTVYATERERQAAKKRRFRASNARRTGWASQFPTFDNYLLWQKVTDHYQRWWLERYPLTELRAMGASFDFLNLDRSSNARLARRDAPGRPLHDRAAA